MRGPTAGRIARACVAGLLALAPAGGCTPLREYVHNGLKVGPNYGRPPAPVAPQWIDADDVRVRSTADDLSRWWVVFNDPALDGLVRTASTGALGGGWQIRCDKGAATAAPPSVPSPPAQPTPTPAPVPAPKPASEEEGQ